MSPRPRREREFPAADRENFFRVGLERIRALPGVEAAGLVNETPLSGAENMNQLFGIALIGTLFISIGCMASALTRNQIIAWVSTAAVLT